MIKKLATSVAAQTETVETLSTNINSSISSAGRNTDKNKARNGLYMCAHCKQEVCHKDVNCLELEENKAKCYPGWKSIFSK